MSSQLLRMLLLQRLQRLIVRLELSQLFLKFADASVETCPRLLELAPKVLNFALVVSLNLLLFSQQTLLVLLELLKTFFLLIDMLLLELLDLLLPCFAFLGPCDGIFLTRDRLVSTLQKSFNFFLVCVLDGRVHGLVFLVLAVQMEDHFG